MNKEYKYGFSWDRIGDISAGRPNLGNMTRVENYRLMQYSLKAVIEESYGTSQVDDLFRKAGELVGKELYDHMIQPTDDLNDFVEQLTKLLMEFSIGILRVEKIDRNNQEFVFTVSEDLDCSGIPDYGYEVCTFDEGIIAALLTRFTGTAFEVIEVDCWATGDKTCRFHARRAKSHREEMAYGKGR